MDIKQMNTSVGPRPWNIVVKFVCLPCEGHS